MTIHTLYSCSSETHQEIADVALCAPSPPTSARASHIELTCPLDRGLRRRLVFPGVSLLLLFCLSSLTCVAFVIIVVWLTVIGERGESGPASACGTAGCFFERVSVENRSERLLMLL